MIAGSSTELVRGCAPPNTAKNTFWAMEVFRDWHAERSTKASPDEECPGELLDNPYMPDVALLNFWLPRFVSEIHRQDGKPYPPRSTHQLQHFCLASLASAVSTVQQ